MKEEKKIGALFGLGILLMPYVFLWPLLRDNYRTRDKVFGVLWMATLVAGIVLAAVQSPESVRSEPSQSGGAQESERADGLISYDNNWEPIYKKFSGVWAEDKLAAESFSFDFKKDDAYAHFRVKKDGSPQGVVLSVMDDDCKEKETGYGVIGDSDQKIGLELVQYQKGAYFYQAVCHDYGSASGYIFVKDSMKALTAYTCREKECGNSKSYIDVSGLRYYKEDTQGKAAYYEELPPAAPANDPLIDASPAGSGG